MKYIYLVFATLPIGLTAPHFYARPEPVHVFTTSYVVVFVFSGFWVNVRGDSTFVHIGGTGYHHCLNFLVTLTRTTVSLCIVIVGAVHIFF